MRSTNCLIAPGVRYQEGVDAHHWQSDPAQLAALVEFDRLHQALGAEHTSAGAGFSGWIKKLGRNRLPRCLPGLYLWGGVGCGKTFLMDLFVRSLPRGMARRWHFHRFMTDVHQRLRTLHHRQDPLVEVADGIARHCRVLCLDECLVHDIGDAMIMARLLKALFVRDVILVTTSNTPPDALYKDGLQRARFLPSIALIRSQCHVLHMISIHDWRLRALSQAPLYYAPKGAEAEYALARIFTSQTRNVVHEGGDIVVNGRPIRLRKRGENVLWFDFHALCEGPRAVADYIELAKIGGMIMVSNVPQFSPYNEDAARRFMHMVDAFYDCRVKLVLSAATPITGLYRGNRMRTEFSRTESRLIEMQSQEYLALAHDQA